jgi:hypothetical protein
MRNVWSALKWLLPGRQAGSVHGSNYLEVGERSASSPGADLFRRSLLFFTLEQVDSAAPSAVRLLSRLVKRAAQTLEYGLMKTEAQQWQSERSFHSL